MGGAGTVEAMMNYRVCRRRPIGRRGLARSGVTLALLTSREHGSNPDGIGRCFLPPDDSVDPRRFKR